MISRRSTLMALIAVVLMTATANGQYWYYYSDGTHISVEAIEDLVAVRFDPSSTPDPVRFAQSNPYLLDSSPIVYLRDNFYTFKLADGYNLQQVMVQLKLEPEIMMVNPVLRSGGVDTTYITSSFLVKLA